MAETDRLRRAKNAERLLQDPTLLEAFHVEAERLTASLVATQPEERERREALYHDLRALGRLKNRLRAFLDPLAKQRAEDGSGKPSESTPVPVV